MRGFDIGTRHGKGYGLMAHGLSLRWQDDDAA